MKIENVEQWCCRWKININPQKSQLLVIKRKRNTRITNNVIIFDKTVPIVSKATYLGLIINNKLNWKDHITNTINKANAAFYRLYCLL